MKRPSLVGLALSAALLVASLPPAGPALAAAVAPGSAAEIVVSGRSRANVRAEPRVADGNVVGKLTAGAAVTVVEATTANGRDWYRVTTADGLEGWVASDLVRAVAAAPAPVMPEEEPAPVPAPDPVTEPAPVVPRADDWTRFVPKLLPAIDACLSIVSIKPAVVTRVYEVEPDMAGVRMRDPTGRRFECLMLRRGGYPIRYDPMGDRLRPMPGDGNPQFVRAPEPAPDDPCLETTPLLDPATGMSLGWRSFKKC